VGGSNGTITYKQMCTNEGVKALERGYNYRLNPAYSVVIVSSSPYAFYENKISPDGEKIECEGHDVRKNMLQLNPKAFDQPRRLKCGRLAQNGLFAEAAEEYTRGKRDAEIVRVYEKLAWGMWCDMGFYHLIGYSYIRAGSRKVFRFQLEKVRRSQVQGKLAFLSLHTSLAPER
jgi:hypothetical protein